MNLLAHYTASQSEGALQQWKLYATQRDPEAMHRFRVCLKKLRAVLRLLLHRHPHNEALKKTARQLRHLFREAGSIRQEELLCAWLQQHRFGKLLDAGQLMSSLAQRQKELLHEQEALSRRMERTFNRMYQVVKAEPTLAITPYGLYLKKEISRLQREERPENWHELRKQIKQLLYTWHWLENRQQLLLLSRREYAYYDELQEAIGHWHDLLDIRDWLTNKQFFFHSDHTVRQSFGRCWVRLSHDTAQQDRVVRKLLARAPAVAAS